MLLKILLPILVVLSLVGGFWYFQNTKKPQTQPAQVTKTTNSPQPSSRTYTNGPNNYSINYPTSWEVQKFPDSKTGANFFPSASGDNFASVIAVIDLHGKTGNSYDVPFAQYVKTAGIQEIQNYNKLNSIKEIKTESGVVGYETTWVVQGLTVMGTTNPSSSFISNPITYFPIPGNNKSTVQVTLENKEFMDGYENMLKTFQFTR